MQPVLFRIGGVPIYSHGFFVLLGLLVGIAVLVLETRRRRWPKEEVWPITLAAFVGGMIGARVSIVFLNGWEAAPVVLNVYNWFDPRMGLGSILGAVGGAYVAGFVVGRLIGKAGCTCDAFAPAMVLALAVGRIGCFLSGEDGLGKATALPWGAQLPGVDHPVHPTPLYDAAFNLVWFGVLVLLRNHPRLQDGNLLKLGVGGYAFFRFWVEFVRNNRVVALGLTAHQFVSLALLAAVVSYFWYLRRRPSVVAPESSR